MCKKNANSRNFTLELFNLKLLLRLSIFCLEDKKKCLKKKAKLFILFIQINNRTFGIIIIKNLFLRILHNAHINNSNVNYFFEHYLHLHGNYRY